MVISVSPPNRENLKTYKFLKGSIAIIAPSCFGKTNLLSEFTKHDRFERNVENSLCCSLYAEMAKHIPNVVLYAGVPSKGKNT